MERQPNPQSIAEALDWHAAIDRSVIGHRGLVLGELRSGVALSDARFTGWTEEEIDLFFARERAEVEGMCIVNIVAAAEAEIRRDYRERVVRRSADALTKAYIAFQRTLTGSKVWRPGFDKEGILEAMKLSGVVPNHVVTAFRHALKLRHWFAHRRHWLLKAQLLEDADSVHGVCQDLLSASPP